MAQTEIRGHGLITVEIDSTGDYITPIDLCIERIYWLPVRSTDKLIIREYFSDRDKADMPYLPISQPEAMTTGIICPRISIRYMIDYSGSTTLTGSVIVFVVG